MWLLFLPLLPCPSSCGLKDALLLVFLHGTPLSRSQRRCRAGKELERKGITEHLPLSEVQTLAEALEVVAFHNLRKSCLVFPSV